MSALRRAMPWLWTREPVMVLSSGPAGVYLRRWVLFRCRWFRIFLHNMQGPDPDRAPHNHPWRAFCVVLKGGYAQTVVEPVPRSSRRQWFGQQVVRCNILRWANYHKLTSVLPDTWTLCFAGPYTREWGFLVDGRHIDWRTYLGLPADYRNED